MNPLGQRIADAVVSEFNSIKIGSAKPALRSNGIQEWTVLAGIVAVTNDDVSVLLVATGVKALPDTVRKYSAGWIVHDLHAEILSLRLLNYSILNSISKGVPLTILEKVGEDTKFRLRHETKLYLYILEPPCGDASMSLKSENLEIWQPPKRAKIVRGRANMDLVGIVRTKPGRADSIPTYSKSCSDKLCLKQFTGVLNSVTSYFVHPIFLSGLVIRQDKYREDDFRRCFSERLSANPTFTLSPLTYSEDTFEFHNLENREPLPLSLLHIPGNATQVLSEGVKNGAHRRKKPPKPTGASIICKRLFCELFKQVAEESKSFSTYSELKKALEEREHLKAKVRRILGDWPATTPDDFALI